MIKMLFWSGTVRMVQKGPKHVGVVKIYFKQTL